MLRQTISAGVCAVIAAASSIQVQTQVNRSAPAVLYEGARLIAGDGSAAIADAAFLVENGTISRVGKRGELTAPAGVRRVSLTGKTVMPTMINAHGHPGFQRGLTYSAENFTRETIIDDLNRALYFGVAAVQSQGIEKGDVTYQIRADQESGKLGGARLRHRRPWNRRSERRARRRCIRRHRLRSDDRGPGAERRCESSPRRR